MRRCHNIPDLGLLRGSTYKRHGFGDGVSYRQAKCDQLKLTVLGLTGYAELGPHDYLRER